MVVDHLPPPGSPEQVEVCDAVVLAVLSLPRPQWSAAVARAVFEYRKAIGEKYLGTDAALLDESALNFVRALRRRFASVHLTNGHVGSA